VIAALLIAILGLMLAIAAIGFGVKRALDGKWPPTPPNS
jgi:hypothetical protein